MENGKNGHGIDVKYLVGVIIRNWYLLLISVVVCLTIAIVFLQLSSKTYLSSMKILIDVEDNRNFGGSNSEYIDVNELMSKNKSLQNELIYINSSPLVKEVVDEMNLITSYYMQEGRVPIPRKFMFTLTDIYNQSPFIVIVDESHPQPLNTLIYVGIRDDETCSIFAFNEFATTFDFEKEQVVNPDVVFEIRGIYRFGETIENEYCSFKILLNSNYNADQYNGKELFFQFNNPYVLVNQFMHNLTLAAVDRESGMVDISFQWGNPYLANSFLNNLVNTYIEKDLQSKNRLANSTIEYIDQQLSNISGSLGQSERQLQNFRSDFDVMSIDEKTRNLSTQINELDRNRENIESGNRSLKRLKDYFEANKEASTFVVPSMLGIEDEVLVTLIREMASLSAERQDLIIKNQVKSLRLKTLNQNIDNYKKVISENIDLLIASTENDLEDIDAQLEELKREYSLLPQTQRRLTGLERNFNITDAAYTALLNKRIEAQIARAANQPDCEIIEPVKNLGIVAPNPIATLAVSIILGLLFPLLYLLARIYLTDRIDNIEEFGRLDALKSVGIIPQSDSKFTNVVTKEAHTPVTEAFHSVKSNLVYYLFGEKNKVILVTSSIPNEGKSYSSLNLASSFATTHNKTILINLDMRKGSTVFSELSDLQGPGISAYLINQANQEEIIRKTYVPNLDYIDKGEIPPDPVALISSNKMKELVDDLKKKYDYIIIDSPPYDVFTDAFLLMNFADIKLFVARVGTITRKALRSCLNDFEMKNIQNIYMMYNDVKHIKDSKYSYYRQRGEKKSRLKKLFRRKKKS